MQSYKERFNLQHIEVIEEVKGSRNTNLAILDSDQVLLQSPKIVKRLQHELKISKKNMSPNLDMISRVKMPNPSKSPSSFINDHLNSPRHNSSNSR